MPKSKQPPPSDETAAPATSQGMPAKEAQEPDSSQPGRQITPKDASVEASLELPSDRDEATDMTAAEPDPQVKQAAKDLKRGLSDTSKGAETDRAYKKLGQ
jgi:hypothetical protein